MAAAGANKSLEDQLFDAIEKENNEEAIRIINKSEVDINAQDPEDGKTALMYAVILARTDVIHALLEKNANKTIKDKSGLTVLHYSTLFGAPLHNKVDTEELENAIGDKNNYRLDKILKEEIPDVNYHEGSGSTPLMNAVRGNYLYGVQKLLSHPEIHVNAVNQRDATALMLACSQHPSRFNEDIVLALLNKDGINLMLESSASKTAWMYLTENGNHTEKIDAKFPPEARVIVSEGGSRRSRTRRNRKQRRARRRSTRRN